MKKRRSKTQEKKIQKIKMLMKQYKDKKIYIYEKGTKVDNMNGIK